MPPPAPSTATFVCRAEVVEKARACVFKRRAAERVNMVERRKVQRRRWWRDGLLCWLKAKMSAGARAAMSGIQLERYSPNSGTSPRTYGQACTGLGVQAVSCQ